MSTDSNSDVGEHGKAALAAFKALIASAYAIDPINPTLGNIAIAQKVCSVERDKATGQLKLSVKITPELVAEKGFYGKRTTTLKAAIRKAFPGVTCDISPQSENAGPNDAGTTEKSLRSGAAPIMLPKNANTRTDTTILTCRVEDSRESVQALNAAHDAILGKDKERRSWVESCLPKLRSGQANALPPF